MSQYVRLCLDEKFRLHTNAHLQLASAEMLDKLEDWEHSTLRMLLRAFRESVVAEHRSLDVWHMGALVGMSQLRSAV